MKLGLAPKIFLFFLSLTLIIIVCISAAYYHITTKDIQKASHRQINIAFEIMSNDFALLAKRTAFEVDTIIRESLAETLHFASLVDFSPQWNPEGSKFRMNIHRLLSRLRKMTEEIAGFAPIVGCDRFLVFDRNATLVSGLSHYDNNRSMGVYLSWLKDGTFISLLTREDRIRSMAGIHNLGHSYLPEDIPEHFSGEIPKNTIARLSHLGGHPTIEFISPMYRNSNLLGVCNFHVPIRLEDILRHARFSQTRINIFVGSELGVGTFENYKSISLDSKDKVLPAFQPLKNRFPRVSVSSITIENVPYYEGRLSFSPPSGQLPITFSVNFPKSIEKEKIETLLTLVILVSMAMGLLAFAAAALLSSKITRPIRELEHAVTRFGEKNLLVTAPVRSSDEIGTLAKAFNKMADELHRSFQQIESQMAKIQEESAERRLAEEKLQASLLEKEILLKEIHHRVKNNLQIVSSLLFLQSKQTRDPKALEMLNESRNRLKTMSIIHEKLYQGEDISRIDLKDYVQTLTDHLRDSLGFSIAKIQLQTRISHIRMDISRAISCGLIINELLSNALKYAYPGGETGTVLLRLTERNKQIHLTVQDNGVGLPEGVDIQNSDTLGLKLVKSLVEQLDGEISLEPWPGVKFEIRFGK